MRHVVLLLAFCVPFSAPIGCDPAPPASAAAPPDDPVALDQVVAHDLTTYDDRRALREDDSTPPTPVDVDVELRAIQVEINAAQRDVDEIVLDLHRAHPELAADPVISDPVTGVDD